MKKLVGFLCLLCMQQVAFSQASPCSVQAFANPSPIACGQEVVLSAFGNGSGNVAFQENFNSGSPTGWQFTQTVTIANNTCGVPSPDGSPFMWMGDASVNPRDMTTVPFNLTLGGTICFQMRYAIQGDASPCEGPDEPQEGVYLQYSTNNGANWTNIQYFDPNGGNDPQLTGWNQYCYVIPPGAMTPNTMIRWHQDAVSGAEYDHWGIDNILITLNDPNYVISWLHDGYSYGFGSSGGENPTHVSPTTTTTYNVQITDGTHTCTNAVQVVVTNPVIIVDAGHDTTICPGECVELNADAYWQIQAPGPVTFVNDVSQSISAGLGSGSTIEIPITVSGLNFNTIQPGSILEVCITNMSYFGQNLFPPSILSIGAFAINLKCPGGTSIQLIPSGVTSSTFILPGYVQTCFSMSATNPISGSAPYTGTFAPNQSFNNLAGCQANGTWIMSLTTTSSLGIGSGNFDGWSITFDDPGLTAPVSYTWSPTVNMTDANTLTPNVCPNFTTTYTLTATNHPGCQPQSDNVTITVPNTCCQLQLDNVVTQQPSCAGGDGSITLQVSGQVTGLVYSIDNGATYQTSPNFTGLNVGSYYVLVHDDNNCPVGQVVVLTNNNAPVINNVNTTAASCSGNDGSITITASGGSGTYQYSVNNGSTFQASNTFTGLGTGNYTIMVKDNAGCSTTATATIQANGGPFISGVQANNPSCGASDGNITILATGNGLQYSIDNGATFQASNAFTTLASGTYNIVVKDNAGCTSTQTATLNDLGAPQITNVAVQNVPCGGGSGSLSITATGGTGMQYSIDNGATFQASNSFTGLSAGNYTVIVRENGCQSSGTATITAAGNMNVQIQKVNDSCLPGCSGSISVQVTGGASPFLYAWSGGISGNSAQANNLCAGTYTVTITDNAGCSSSQTVTISTENQVTAGFDFHPSIVELPNGLVQFTNTSQGADTYAWTFGPFGSSSDANPVFDFGVGGAGSYTVCLVASNAAGCTAEQCRSIQVKDDIIVYVPNSFTPGNNDALNQTFYPISREILDGKEFEFKVFSRWGELLFSSAESVQGWDGTFRGKAVPPDVYVWKLKINYPAQPEKVLLGHVNVIR